MSLTGALYNAYSGIKANARSAEIVSTNISNATTEGYGRRELALTPGAAGTTGGVLISGVIRHVDPVLVSDRMRSDAELGYANDMVEFARQVEFLVGESGTSGSLTDRVTSFENALLSAASNPASTQRLEMVATTADALARALNTLSDDLQAARLAADASIDAQVTRLNDAMVQLDKINGAVVAANSSGGETATLLDERQRLLDGISEIVPLRIVEQDRGAVYVYTTGGAKLLGDSPYEIGFSKSNIVSPGLTMAAGDLSGLSLYDMPIDSTETGMFAGGSLAAQFQIRDSDAVTFQAQLDGIARDLVERLGSGGPDTTLAATDPGLFTDTGLAFNAADEVGLAGRISLNSLVEPGSGGVWRLRDGLGAAAMGDVGDARLLQGIAAALTTPVAPASGALPPAARGFSDHASEFVSGVAGSRVRFENQQSFLSTQNTALSELEFSRGVDTDQELQRLMQIEQHYSANAKVMSVVDELMERLLAI